MQLTAAARRMAKPSKSADHNPQQAVAAKEPPLSICEVSIELWRAVLTKD